MNSHQRVYEALKDKMSHNLEQYILLNTPYTQEETPMILEIINSDEIFKVVVGKSIKISRQTFEEHIPNERVGLAYVNLYFASSDFYVLSDDSDQRTTYMLMKKNGIGMFYETLPMPLSP